MILLVFQPLTKAQGIGKEDEITALATIFDSIDAAFIAQDASTLASFLREDALCFGTDPSEIWTKQQITDLWAQMLADHSPAFSMISKRVIKVAPDGKSASVLEQYIMPEMSSELSMRNHYHLVKTENSWKVLVLCSSFILNNEDIPKVDNALHE
jgi:ketosteroid isomerase-like protein